MPEEAYNELEDRQAQFSGSDQYLYWLLVNARKLLPF
jgi:hypothetical protein